MHLLFPRNGRCIFRDRHLFLASLYVRYNDTSNGYRNTVGYALTYGYDDYWEYMMSENPYGYDESMPVILDNSAENFPRLISFIVRNFLCHKELNLLENGA